MRAFEFAPASSLSEVSELLTSDGQSARVIAGGTDLLGEIKEGVVDPGRLVSLQEVANLRSVRVYMDGVLIGAMATIADVGAHTLIQSSYAALAQACDSVATPQIRNVGTIGGNLCQRPRCWYYRSPLFDCRKKGGSIASLLRALISSMQSSVLRSVLLCIRRIPLLHLLRWMRGCC